MLKFFSMSLLLVLIPSISQTHAYTIKLVFTAQYDSLFQAGELWENVDPDDVKDLIEDFVADDFSPFGVSVSTSTGNITIEIGGRKESLFGEVLSGFGGYSGTATGYVYSSRFTDLNTLRDTSATAARISNAIAGTVAHEAAHIFNVYHAFKYDSFDPTASGALYSNGEPREPVHLDSSLKTDPYVGEHLLSTLADHSAEEKATVDRYFAINSTHCIDFAASGGKNVTINMTWGLGTTFYQQQDFTVSSGKTLILTSGNPNGSYTHHMNGHAILLAETGNVIKYTNATVIPENTINTRLQTGSTVKILGKSVQATIDTASTGNTVLLLSGTYNENIDMSSGVHLKRSGNGTAMITGTVDFNSISGNNVDSIRFTGVVTLYSTSGVTFTGCEFWSGSTYGVSVTNGTPNFFNGCDFWASTDGIKLNNHDPFLDECLIHGNSRYGINATNGSEPDVSTENHLYENWYEDIIADSDCDDIYAQYNYWDTDPPNVYHDNGSATIYVNPYFSHKPVVGSSHSVALRRQARSLLKEGQIDEAIDRYQNIIYDFPESHDALLSVGHIASAYSQLGKDIEGLGFLENIAHGNFNVNLVSRASFHTIPILVNLDRFDDAIIRANELIETYPNSKGRSPIV